MSSSSMRSVIAKVAKRKLEELRRTDYRRYQFDPAGFIREVLGWEPWGGTEEQPGQAEVIADYRLALLQLHDRRAYERGETRAEDLQHWQPGQEIANILHIEAGHSVGKTILAAGLVLHFLYCFRPSIIYTFAPTWPQVKKLLWKEIGRAHRRAGLPGRPLESCELKLGDDHFATGMATTDAGGAGTERVQGQHGEYLMFVLDEAEGVADFVYEAMESMMAGGIAIAVMQANPRTRQSRFHRTKRDAGVRSRRISCEWHPNVLTGREVVPNAVRRSYVERMLAQYATRVDGHDADKQTFEVPWRPGEIWMPSPIYLWRVQGRPPRDMSERTLIPLGRYEAACARTVPLMQTDPAVIRMGIDCARFGTDSGTGYVLHEGRARRFAQFWHTRTGEYVEDIREEALRIQRQVIARHGETNPATGRAWEWSLHVRVDAGYGSGIVDGLYADLELSLAFADFQVHEVAFGGAAVDDELYADLVTELYATAGEVLQGICVVDPPEALEADLCEREYKPKINRRGVAVKKLEEKEDFRRRKSRSAGDRGRSPDDGDGFVLAVAPDHLFRAQAAIW